MSQRFFVVFISAWVLLVGQVLTTVGMSAAFDQPDFHNILEAYGTQLSTVTTPTQAKTFFVNHLAQALDLKDVFSTSAGKGDRHPSPSAANQNPAFPNPDTSAIRLTADLAAWRLANAMKHAADAEEPAGIHSVLEQTERQRHWLLGEHDSPLLRRIVNLASVLSSISMVDLQLSDPSARYVEYAEYLDRSYPRFTGSEDSWLVIAERDGINVILHRLASFWSQPHAAGPLASQADDHTHKILETRYFQLRLRPVFTAHLIALAIRVEAEAEEQARAEWVSLRAWPEKRRELRGLARLCGTWQWTVHNHQNHQDHKMVMVFPPPDTTSPVRAHPAKITVLGDGVYLRWDFQGGYQEDSLLFTGEGQRLEGSFANSAGAWGSITGKRIAACGK